MYLGAAILPRTLFEDKGTRLLYQRGHDLCLITFRSVSCCRYNTSQISFIFWREIVKESLWETSWKIGFCFFLCVAAASAPALRYHLLRRTPSRMWSTPILLLINFVVYPGDPFVPRNTSCCAILLSEVIKIFELNRFSLCAFIEKKIRYV